MSRIVFVKAQASSFMASAIDFLTTVILVEIIGEGYMRASVMGTISGGISNFFVNRIWVYESDSKRLFSQLFKFLMVWCINLFLNSSGVFLFTHYCHINYAISKVTVSMAVGYFYNYQLHKRFVFK